MVHKKIINNEQKILSFLKNNKKYSYTIKVISKEIKLERHTTSKHIKNLFKKDKITLIIIGNYKLWKNKNLKIKGDLIKNEENKT